MRRKCEHSLDWQWVIKLEINSTQSHTMDFVNNKKRTDNFLSWIKVLVTFAVGIFHNWEVYFITGNWTKKKLLIKMTITEIEFYQNTSTQNFFRYQPFETILTRFSMFLTRAPLTLFLSCLAWPCSTVMGSGNATKKTTKMAIIFLSFANITQISLCGMVKACCHSIFLLRKFTKLYNFGHQLVSSFHCKNYKFVNL